MNRFIRFLLLFAGALSAVHGQDPTGTSTVTIGVGGGWPLNSHTRITGGPQFNGTYEYRLQKYWAIDVGVDTTVVKVSSGVSSFILPGETLISTSVLTPISSPSKVGGRATAVPFGVRGLLPLSGGRVELAAGVGGAYLWNPSQSSNWAAQVDVGARVAIDKQKHFWLGTTGRVVQSFQGNPRQWLTWTADLGFRFGH